jgi:hypothetical protein
VRVCVCLCVCVCVCVCVCRGESHLPVNYIALPPPHHTHTHMRTHTPSITPSIPIISPYRYFGPDFRLHISPTNMDNQNTPEYLQKCMERIIENLRHVQHAPGQQATTLERSAISADKEAAARDAAEDASADKGETEDAAAARVVKLHPLPPPPPPPTHTRARALHHHSHHHASCVTASPLSMYARTCASWHLLCTAARSTTLASSWHEQDAELDDEGDASDGRRDRQTFNSADADSAKAAKASKPPTAAAAAADSMEVDGASATVEGGAAVADAAAEKPAAASDAAVTATAASDGAPANDPAPMET